MWEHHGIGIGGYAGLPANGRGQPCRVDTQQHQIGPAGVKPVRRQMHLLGSRQVDEPVRYQRVGAVLTAGLRPAPLVGAAEVDQHGRQRFAYRQPALPATRRNGETRHTGKPPGNKAETESV